MRILVLGTCLNDDTTKFENWIDGIRVLGCRGLGFRVKKFPSGGGVRREPHGCAGGGGRALDLGSPRVHAGTPF